jgi:hypothetical protein
VVVLIELMVMFKIEQFLQDYFRRLEIGVEVEFECVSVCLADVVIDQIPQEIF